MNKGKFLATISSIAKVVGTSACIDSSSKMAQSDVQQDYIKSTARQFAQKR